MWVAFLCSTNPVEHILISLNEIAPQGVVLGFQSLK